MKNKISPRLVLCLGLILSILPAVRAADGPATREDERRERMKEGANRIGEALGLTEDQKTKIKAINEAEKAELAGLRGNGTGDKKEMRGEMQAIRKKYHEQRQAVLTPEQREKAEKMREQMEKRGERMDRREKALN